MHLVTIKPERAREITKATGIEFTYVNNNLNAVQIPTGDTFVRIQVESYSVSAAEPAPPKMEAKWRVLGSPLGVLVQRDFDEKWEAEEYRDTLRTQLSTSAFDDADIRIEQVEVEVSLN